MAPINPWNSEVRRDLQDNLALCGGQSNTPPPTQEVYVLILRTYGSVNLHGKRYLHVLN